jgi:hypothetical protein
LIILVMLGEEYKLWSSSLCSLLHPLVTSILFGPNIFLSTLFPDTLSLCSSLNVKDEISYQYKTTGKIVLLYFYSFGQQTTKQNVLDWMVANITRIKYLDFLLNGKIIENNNNNNNSVKCVFVYMLTQELVGQL